jgi:archaellum component FlaC
MSSYPEKIPDGIGSINAFPFSFTAGKNVKRELEFQLDQINTRIEKIVDHFVYNDIFIVHYILKASNQKNDLKKLAKAINRLADLVEVQENLSSRLNIVKVLETDTAWFTSTFSDYSSEIDQDLINIINNQ